MEMDSASLPRASISPVAAVADSAGGSAVVARGISENWKLTAGNQEQESDNRTNQIANPPILPVGDD